MYHKYCCCGKRARSMNNSSLLHLVPSGLRVSLEIFVVLNQSNWCTSAFQDIKRLLRFLSKENKRTAICTFYQWHCSDRRRN